MVPEPSIRRPVANPWSIAPSVEVSPVTKSEQKGVIVKVAPVSIVTGNEGLGAVQEKEDRWGPVDAMLHSMVSHSTGRDENKGAKWNSGGVAGWFGWFVGTKGGEDGTQKRL